MLHTWLCCHCSLLCFFFKCTLQLVRMLEGHHLLSKHPKERLEKSHRKNSLVFAHPHSPQRKSEQFSRKDFKGLLRLALVSSFGYIAFFSVGLGPVPWLMMGEVFPGKIRSSASSLAAGFNWTCSFITTETVS